MRVLLGMVIVVVMLALYAGAAEWQNRRWEKKAKNSLAYKLSPYSIISFDSKAATPLAFAQATKYYNSRR